MVGIVIRVLINVLGLWLATALISGITAQTSGALVWAAISLGLVNAFIRPLVVFLTLPFTLVTLGVFLLFVNAAMLNLAAWFVDGFDVVGRMGVIQRRALQQRKTNLIPGLPGPATTCRRTTGAGPVQ